MKKRSLTPVRHDIVTLPVFTNEEMWRAIDELASDHDLSPSRLAIRAGYDPTLFNVCRRRRRDGQYRALSMEVIAAVLDATGESLVKFAKRLDKRVNGRLNK